MGVGGGPRLPVQGDGPGGAGLLAMAAAQAQPRIDDIGLVARLRGLDLADLAALAAGRALVRVHRT